MKRLLLAVTIITTMSSLTFSQSQSAQKAIEENTKQFIEAFNKGDAAAVANMYTMDARVLPPNSEMVEGRANIQKFWQGAITAGLKMSTLETVHVEQQGNLAVEVGRYTTTMSGAGDTTTTDQGKYVVVWKRDGKDWKLAVDIFNTNRPQTTATP
jgi:uncharacterized protein (TIGR02246 family)